MQLRPKGFQQQIAVNGRTDDPDLNVVIWSVVSYECIRRCCSKNDTLATRAFLAATPTSATFSPMATRFAVVGPGAVSSLL